MDKEKVLRILILTDFVLGVSAWVCEVALEPFLPAPLRAYLAAEGAEAANLSDVLLTALWVAVLVGTVLAWVGLLCLLKPARPLYLASWIGYLALIALRGPNVSSPAGYVVDMLMSLVGGMILGIVYFSDLRPRFRSLPRVAGKPLENAA